MESRIDQEERTKQVINEMMNMDYSRNRKHVTEIYYYLRQLKLEDKRDFLLWVKKIADEI